MITLYTLAQSRSHRGVWLLEELSIPYQLQQFERDPITRLAPQTLKAITADPLAQCRRFILRRRKKPVGCG